MGKKSSFIPGIRCTGFRSMDVSSALSSALQGTRRVEGWKEGLPGGMTQKGSRGAGSKRQRKKATNR